MLPNAKLPLPRPVPVVYPETDGKPMSDNTKQLRWIVVIYDNLKAIFQARLDVFVSGNQFWYPVEGQPEIVQAPDVYVVFSRPKGDRSSYKQWAEDNVPMTVVFEVLSPSNTVEEMDEKLDFYDEYGVEEYYIYNPDTNRLTIWIRRGEVFRRIRPVSGFVSPRLGVRFDLSGPELAIFGPDDQRFVSFDELKATSELAKQQAEQARQLVARLSELSRKARQSLASTEELQELEDLETRYSQGGPG